MKKKNLLCEMNLNCIQGNVFALHGWKTMCYVIADCIITDAEDVNSDSTSSSKVAIPKLSGTWFSKYNKVVQ